MRGWNERSILWVLSTDLVYAFDFLVIYPGRFRDSLNGADSTQHSHTILIHGLDQKFLNASLVWKRCTIAVESCLKIIMNSVYWNLHGRLSRTSVDNRYATWNSFERDKGRKFTVRMPQLHFFRATELESDFKFLKLRHSQGTSINICGKMFVHAILFNVLKSTT